MNRPVFGFLCVFIGLNVFTSFRSPVNAAVDPGGWGFSTSFVMDGWLRTPSLRTLAIANEFRSLPKGRVRESDGRVFAGVSLESVYYSADHWVIPLVGLKFSVAFPTVDATFSSLDGTILRTVHRNSYLMSFDLPGIGYRWVHRRWAFQLGARFHADMLFVRGEAAFAGETRDVNPYNVWLGMSASVDVCRRTEPTVRTCISVSPAILRGTWLNGGSLALRLDLW